MWSSHDIDIIHASLLMSVDVDVDVGGWPVAVNVNVVSSCSFDRRSALPMADDTDDDVAVVAAAVVVVVGLR